MSYLFMKSFRAISFYCLILIGASVLGGCAATQQRSNSAAQPWGYGILNFVGASAYQGAQDNMAQQHP
jgi:hypothetical protein